jgi:integrase
MHHYLSNDAHMPNYTLQGKLMQPITPDEFEAALANAYNQPEHHAFIILEYYAGTRVSEGLRAMPCAFTWDSVNLYWDVGIRLKTMRKRKDGSVSKGKRTDPISISRQLPHVEELVAFIQKSKKNKRIFDFDRSTAWRHFNKSGLGYNHHARLSAITFYLSKGYSVAHIVARFGISVQTVNAYIGRIDDEKMGAEKR